MLPGREGAESPKESYSSQEVARITSPDQRFDAVVLAESYGEDKSDTTALTHVLHIVEHGATDCNNRVASFSRAERNKGAAGISVRWASSNQVVVEYLRASNVWHTVEPKRFTATEIKTVLRSDVATPSAKPGSMAGAEGQTYPKRPSTCH